jgi:hypothetical protein
LQPIIEALEFARATRASKTAADNRDMRPAALGDCGTANYARRDGSRGGLQESAPIRADFHLDSKCEKGGVCRRPHVSL